MIAFNAISQLVALGLVLVFQTLYMVIVARLLGPEDFGRFSFAWSLIQILLIGGDLGLHNAALRAISSRRDESPSICITFLGLKIALTVGLFLLVLVLALILPATLETRLLLVLFGGGMLFHCLTLAVNIIFQAHGKLYWASLTTVLVFGGQFLFGACILWQGGRLVALGWAYLLAALATLLIQYQILKRNLHPLHLGRPRGWKTFVRDSLPVGLGTLFHTVSGRIGVPLVALLADSFQAGIFAASYRIVAALSNIPICIFSAIIPVMAARQGDRPGVRTIFLCSLLLMVALSVPFAIFLYILAPPLIQLVYGPQYGASIGVLQIGVWSLIPVFVGMAFSHVLLSQDALVARLSVVTGVAMVINLLINFLLIPQLGAPGAAWAGVLTELTLAVGYVLAVLSFLRSSASQPDASKS